MDTCTVETGLLKKKPCGHAAVTRCLNCEQALCAQHAVPELSEAGKKTGKFVCKECKGALREIAKNQPPPAVKKSAEPAKAAPAPAKEGSAAPKPTDAGGIDYTPTKK